MTPNHIQAKALFDLSASHLDDLSTVVGEFIDDVIDLGRERLGGDERSINGRNQVAAHAVAWMGAYAFVIRSAIGWYRGLGEQASELDRLLFCVGVGRFLRDLSCGMQVGATERLGLADIYGDAIGNRLTGNPLARDLVRQASDPDAGQRLAELLAELGLSASGGTLGQASEIDMLRDQYRRYVAAEVREQISKWHEADQLIPQAVIDDLGAMGTFGVTIPESLGGLGQSLEVMCAISEELSRGALSVGSLATRSEIGAHLLLGGGSQAQCERYLPELASGALLPCAVFTEPNAGSDLGSISTRAIKTVDGYEVNGNKTWITHAARSDLMFVLARTDLSSKDHEGLSMFVVDKQRGTDALPFPDPGIDGSEIPVLGYRGMKEYELRFEGFNVPRSSLLGDSEGHGFRHLMSTFEIARIQTAARAVGVAHCALDLGLGYSLERKQFGQPLLKFPRIAGKIANAAADLMLIRQALYSAARLKDQHKRCDMEAGMVKLLAARLAWQAADDALQIHGGNGYALEFPISRVLCDARILSIFEGASEIQAHVIARAMLRRETDRKPR